MMCILLRLMCVYIFSIAISQRRRLYLHLLLPPPAPLRAPRAPPLPFLCPFLCRMPDQQSLMLSTGYNSEYKKYITKILRKVVKRLLRRSRATIELQRSYTAVRGPCSARQLSSVSSNSSPNFSVAAACV